MVQFLEDFGRLYGVTVTAEMRERWLWVLGGEDEEDVEDACAEHLDSFVTSEIFPTPAMILERVRAMDAARQGEPGGLPADPDLQNVVPMRFR